MYAGKAVLSSSLAAAREGAEEELGLDGHEAAHLGEAPKVGAARPCPARLPASQRRAGDAEEGADLLGRGRLAALAPLAIAVVGEPRARRVRKGWPGDGSRHDSPYATCQRYSLQELFFSDVDENGH